MDKAKKALHVCILLFKFIRELAFTNFWYRGFLSSGFIFSKLILNLCLMGFLSFI